MAYLVIEVNADSKSIDDYNAQVLLGGTTKPRVCVNALKTLLDKVLIGAAPATVKMVSKDASTTISTSGTSSTSITLTLT